MRQQPGGMDRAARRRKRQELGSEGMLWQQRAAVLETLLFWTLERTAGPNPLRMPVQAFDTYATCQIRVEINREAQEVVATFELVPPGAA